jgi:hypothetical protein
MVFEISKRRPYPTTTEVYSQQNGINSSRETSAVRYAVIVATVVLCAVMALAPLPLDPWM